MKAPKMVVFETPVSDEILKDTKISKHKLQKIFGACFFGGQGVYKNPMLNFQEMIVNETGKEITLQEAAKLANIIVHFGTKAIKGSNKAQLGDKVLTIDCTAKMSVELQITKEEPLPNNHIVHCDGATLPENFISEPQQ